MQQAHVYCNRLYLLSLQQSINVRKDLLLLFLHVPLDI